MANFFIYSILIILIIALILYFKRFLNKHKSYIKTYTVVILALWLVISVIIYPREAVEAAKGGLYTWGNVVLPALLPFFIGSEILIGLGVVSFLGSLLQPLMKPIFNVPGEGSFPLAMSITSGYPVGTKLVSKLRSENVISKTEAQRLVSFCSTSGPLFMIGAVSVGMFNNVRLGPLIALSHYLGAISVGLIFRFYKGKEKALGSKVKKNYIKNAFKELIRARKRDGRNIGVLMGDAVKDAMNTMFIVGGFIILYSVIIRILDITNILNYASYILTAIVPINLNQDLIKATLSGVIEMTNGCKLISSIEEISLITKVVFTSFLIGWSGFSIHSQSMTMLGKTDINGKIYIFSKGLHGFFGAVYSYILYNFIFKSYITTAKSVPTFFNEGEYIKNWILTFRFSLEIGLSVILAILFGAIVIGTINKINFRLTK